MLNHLSISNYALIDNLNTHFPSGLITITGETGAGKSIILGALKLILGERADPKSLKNPEEKCLIEAEFLIKKKEFLSFFNDNDLDFEEHTIIRREILPSGKSRAFINDTPVTLDILQNLSSKLIDIHSQFETSDLLNEKYQLHLLDSFSRLNKDLEEYQETFLKYVDEKNKLKILKEQLNIGTQNFEYDNYLLDELDKANLNEINLSSLEEELNLMKNSEYLSQVLSSAYKILNSDEIGILTQLQEISSQVEKGAHLSTDLEKLADRFTSSKVELQDISFEIENVLEKLDFDPEKYSEYTDQINIINGLLKKHKVNTQKELIDIRDNLAKNTLDVSSLEMQISNSEKLVDKYILDLKEKAIKLHQERKKNIPILEKKIIDVLAFLGMEKSKIKIDLLDTQLFQETGTDKISILFSANTGKDVQSIGKAISGGERSRIMLAIKKIMAENESLPTLLLDEIDTGVSGRIANEMGILMKEMAHNMQLIVITHLPQIAAKGISQFKVKKEVKNNSTITQIELLNNEERIEEIAQLISGSNITEIARKQAIELLK